MSKAWERGYDAWAKGEDLNPYAPDSASAEEWWQGYSEAEEMSGE